MKTKNMITRIPKLYPSYLGRKIALGLKLLEECRQKKCCEK